METLAVTEDRYKKALSYEVERGDRKSGWIDQRL